MEKVKQRFEEIAAQYDVWIEKVCPYYGEAHDILVRMLPARAHYILELGCGTGNGAIRILDKYPNACYTGVDISHSMLAIAKDKLATHKHVNLIESDFNSFSLQYTYDVVVASLALHHLTPKRKEYLFELLHKQLASGGYFFIMDSVQGSDTMYEHCNSQEWIFEMKKNGLTENDIKMVLDRKKEHDHWQPLFEQLMMLRKVGFSGIDVLFKKYSLAIFGARKY